MAAVPLTVAIAYLLPTVLANSSSKVSTYLPTLDTNVESMQSLRYFFSLPINRGSCNGIKSFVLKVCFIKSTIFCITFSHQDIYQFLYVQSLESLYKILLQYHLLTKKDV